MLALGELEETVMGLLWASDRPLSVREVQQLLSARRQLAYTTVMTVLDRLAKKGFAIRELGDRAWLYQPSRTRAEEFSAQIAQLLDQLGPSERIEVLAAIGATPN